MSFKDEFPKEYAISEAIQQLVGAGFLVDESWHNDMCPKFAVVNRPYHTLWCEPERPEDREFPEGTRYRIDISDRDGQWIETVLETDDVDEVVRFVSEIV